MSSFHALYICCLIYVTWIFDMFYILWAMAPCSWIKWTKWNKWINKNKIVMVRCLIKHTVFLVYRSYTWKSERQFCYLCPKLSLNICKCLAFLGSSELHGNGFWFVLITTTTRTLMKTKIQYLLIFHASLMAYILTLRSRFHLLYTPSALVILTFGTQRFITMFTGPCHYILSYARWLQAQLSNLKLK